LGKDGSVISPVIRRALAADAEAVHAVIERSIRVSAASVYPGGAVEAWAGGRTVEVVAG